MGGPRRLLGVTAVVVTARSSDMLSSNSSAAAQSPPSSAGGSDAATFGSPFMVIMLVVLMGTFLCMGVFTFYVRRFTERLGEAAGGSARGRAGSRGRAGLDAASIQKLPLVVYVSSASASASSSCSSKYINNPCGAGAAARVREDDEEEAEAEGEGEGEGGANSDAAKVVVAEKLKRKKSFKVVVLRGKKRVEAATTECVVCLADFQEHETLKLLPACHHCFHPDCIDMWLFSHTTCPLCRQPVLALLPDPPPQQPPPDAIPDASTPPRDHV